MSRTNRFVDNAGFALCGALAVAVTGCTAYVGQPRSDAAYATPYPAAVQDAYVGIRTESDFYQPLSAYGRWEVVGSYGRCWIPERVGPEWRPYSNGHWQRTDAGWFWVSDEPWAWATYHYGRWDLSAQFGWYWVPQTQWAPAWVSWRQGAGYVGWAPLHPSSRFGRRGDMEVDASVLPPRAYVFVEERQFLQPVRPTTVVVNNTTIINKTVNITNIKVVNKTVINEGPPAPAIERVSGRKVQAVPARGLRHQQEAEAVAKQPITTPIREREGHPPARNEAEPRTIQTQKDADRRAMDAENKARVEAEQRGADQRVKAAQKQAQQEADQRAIEAEKKARFEAEQRGTDQRVKAAQKQAQQEADQRAIEAEKKARFEAEQRGADQRENRDVQTKSKGHAKAQDDDQATISRVKKALAADSQLNGVNAEVAQGMVRLSGVVDTRGQKNKAGAIANKVEGVRGVQNGITVKEDRP